jgi:hypothetical protein
MRRSKNVYEVGPKISGNPYFSSTAQGLAGKQVNPQGFAYFRGDPNKMIWVIVGPWRIPVTLLSRHPPVEQLEPLARPIF